MDKPWKPGEILLSLVRLSDFHKNLPQIFDTLPGFVPTKRIPNLPIRTAFAALSPRGQRLYYNY